MSHAWRSLIFSTALLLGMVQAVSACQCVHRPTVLDAFEKADEVVIAKATAGGYTDGSPSTTMVVEKVFKGNLKLKQQIVFGHGSGSDCLWTFRGEVVGRRFLFYLNRPDSQFYPMMAPRSGLWYGFVCGRSNDAEAAIDDLLYLENLNTVRGKTRISGTVGGWVNSGFKVEGIRIKLIGPTQTYETKTNKNGVFEIYDLPPGKYFIEPDIPAGWKIDPFWLVTSASVVMDQNGQPELKTPRQVAIMLDANKHAGVDIDFVEDK